MAFHNVIFPEDYSRGVVGGPEFRTTVVATGSGYEQRNADWATARARWDLSRLLYDPTARDATIAFFRARQGRAHTFLFKDWADYYVGMAWNSTTKTLDHSGSHNFGSGDGSTVAFQVYRVYDSGGYTERRKITRLKDPIKVYKDGVEQTQPGQCSVSLTTGIITFVSAPAGGTVIGWGGEFYVPVRFDTDQLQIEYLSPTVGDVALPIVEVRE
ncbi:MAG: DUF2460 domain-containing protein [Pyrinomonadaceae bacterium]